MGTETNRDDDIIAMCRRIFGDSDAYLDFYRRIMMPKNKVLTVYEGDRLVSMMHLNPYNLHVGRPLTDSYYIVAVATEEDKRHQGLMAGLMQRAMTAMYAEDIGFTYLMPADEDIYKPFDFTTVWTKQMWKVRKNALAADMEKLHFKNWLDATDAEKKETAEYTAKMLHGPRYVYCRRTVPFYDRIAEEMDAAGGELLICYREAPATVAGYGSRAELYGMMSYMLEERAVEVIEILTPEENTGRVFLKNLWQRREGEFDAMLLLEDSSMRGEKQYKRLPGQKIMMRLVHPERFIPLLPCRENFAGIIALTDPLIPENNGRFLLNLGDRCSFRPVREGMEAECQGLAEYPMTEAELMAFVWEKSGLQALLTEIV